MLSGRGLRGENTLHMTFSTRGQISKNTFAWSILDSEAWWEFVWWNSKLK